ncbi:MAG: 30S ribosomal protein S9 [Candidatus Xiphinematobacter sp.]|nr:MAG: 30S ribosomal protein S9 [Candidatus Xiphinematobacter sp.]
MPNNSTSSTSTGRRKTAVAHLQIKPGKGVIKVNDKDFVEYFPSISMQNEVLRPLELVRSMHSFDLTVKTKGGGIAGQAGALRLAISRALILTDASFRPILKKEGMLTRDPRMKERKKTGQPGARRRFQFSKR